MDQAEQEQLIEYAKLLIKHDAQALAKLAEQVDVNFSNAVAALCNVSTSGHVIVSGMGKAGIIGMKISATLASIGIPSFFLHPAEALHGDLGRFTRNDLALVLSNSGETAEITKMIPAVKKIGCQIIAITADAESSLSKQSDTVLLIGNHHEAGPLGVAPTTSTSLMLALGNALAMSALKHKKTSIEEFAFYHPGGSLGKALLNASELMRVGDNFCVVSEHEKTKDVVQKIAATPGRPGAAAVINSEGLLVGIFTDGDLRSHLSIGTDFLEKPIEMVMGKTPKTVPSNMLAKDVLKLLRQYRIDQIIVADDYKIPLGMIDIQDLI